MLRYFTYLLVLVGLKKDEQLGLHLLSRLARRVCPAYRFTWPDLDWFSDQSLNQLLLDFDEKDSWNAHRRQALKQLLRLSAGIPGDTAECGVYKGLGSAIILQANQTAQPPRMHHIFDSFEGLSTIRQEDGCHWKQGDLSIDEKTVMDTLAPYGRFQIYKGWIPTRFFEVQEKQFSFVHLDVDLYEPSRDSVVFFYDRLSPGAIFVCDDYGFGTCPGATQALDEFLQDKPEKMIALSGGGGFFIKGAKTSLVGALSCPPTYAR